MPSVDKIKEMIHNANPSKEKQIFRMKEVPELEKFLHADEVILRVTPAMASGKDYTHNGLFIATNRRCFFFYKGGIITKVIAEQFPYNKLSSVSFHSGFIAADLLIQSSGANVFKVGMIEKKEIQELCDFLNTKAREATQIQVPITPVQTQAHVPTDDLVAQLEKLATLKANGILSDEEFAQAKAKLLI